MTGIGIPRRFKNGGLWDRRPPCPPINTYMKPFIFSICLLFSSMSFGETTKEEDIDATLKRVFGDTSPKKQALTGLILSWHCYDYLQSPTKKIMVYPYFEGNSAKITIRMVIK